MTKPVVVLIGTGGLGQALSRRVGAGQGADHAAPAGFFDILLAFY